MLGPARVRRRHVGAEGLVVVAVLFGALSKRSLDTALLLAMASAS